MCEIRGGCKGCKDAIYEDGYVAGCYKENEQRRIDEILYFLREQERAQEELYIHACKV